jgi:hypothetical protein
VVDKVHERREAMKIWVRSSDSPEWGYLNFPYKSETQVQALRKQYPQAQFKVSEEKPSE